MAVLPQLDTQLRQQPQEMVLRAFHQPSCSYRNSLHQPQNLLFRVATVHFEELFTELWGFRLTGE